MGQRFTDPSKNHPPGFTSPFPPWDDFYSNISYQRFILKTTVFICSIQSTLIYQTQNKNHQSVGWVSASPTHQTTTPDFKSPLPQGNSNGEGKSKSIPKTKDQPTPLN
jgi:hypothetical protein